MALRADVEAEVPEWTFGDRLRKARKVSGVSSDQIVATLGRASKRSVYTWEQDINIPRDPWKVARAYSDLTGVSFDWLLTGVRTGSFSFDIDGLPIDIAA